MFSRPIFKNPNLPTPPLRFPQKLWKIANECQSGAVCWSPDGKSILLRYSLFREEFMSTTSELFKTDNISSFVRQLNLYGFRKVYDHAHKQAYKANPDLHEFSNTYFQRHRPDLLDKVIRKSGILKERNDLWPENNKSMDFLDESSCDKAETNDHSYLCNMNDETRIKPFVSTKLEEKVKNPVQNIGTKDNMFVGTSNVFSENVPEQILQTPDASDLDILLPVKRKRGRKPGSKRNQLQVSRFSSDFNGRIYYSPTLKNPEKYPNLIYFDDDDDETYLRNTSKDVMLSSTLPFHENPEYLELKETYHRLYGRKRKVGYGTLPFCLGKIFTS